MLTSGKSCEKDVQGSACTPVTFLFTWSYLKVRDKIIFSLLTKAAFNLNLATYISFKME